MIYKATKSRICKWCRKSFVPKAEKQQCCNDKCRGFFWRSKNPRVNIEILKVIEIILKKEVGIKMKFDQNRYFLDEIDMSKIVKKYGERKEAD